MCNLGMVSVGFIFLYFRNLISFKFYYSFLLNCYAVDIWLSNNIFIYGEKMFFIDSQQRQKCSRFFLNYYYDM